MEELYSPEQIERIASILEGDEPPADLTRRSFLREKLAILLPALAEKSLIWKELEQNEPSHKTEKDSLESLAGCVKRLQKSLGKLPKATVIRINSAMGREMCGESEDLQNETALASMGLCQWAIDTIALLERSINKTLGELPQVRSGRPEGEAWLFNFINALRAVYVDITRRHDKYTRNPYDNDNSIEGPYVDFVKACVEPFWDEPAGSAFDYLIRKSTQSS